MVCVVLLNVFGSERNIRACVITIFKEDIFTLLSYYHFSTFEF